MFLKLDRFHETPICIIFFQYTLNIYSCLFRAAYIKQENIDSHAA